MKLSRNCLRFMSACDASGTSSLCLLVIGFIFNQTGFLCSLCGFPGSCSLSPWAVSVLLSISLSAVSAICSELRCPDCSATGEGASDTGCSLPVLGVPCPSFQCALHPLRFSVLRDSVRGGGDSLPPLKLRAILTPYARVLVFRHPIWRVLF